MTKEVAKQTTKEVATVDSELFAGTGMDTGFEGTSGDTFKTPFLKILQALSPELKKSGADYVQGAEMGMFLNTATKETYNSINVVVLKVDHSVVVWKPDRGGFVGRYPKAQEGSVVVETDGLKKWDKDGNDAFDTLEFFCMNADDPSDIFILPMSTTSLKYGKSWATRLRLLKANGRPVNVSWAGVWNISLIEETNDKGSWYSVGNTPEFVRFITQEERDGFVLPAKEMLSSAEADYSVVEPKTSSEESENVTY